VRLEIKLFASPSPLMGWLLKEGSVDLEDFQVKTPFFVVSLGALLPSKDQFETRTQPAGLCYQWRMGTKV
jgi:hypothetical protein